MKTFLKIIQVLLMFFGGLFLIEIILVSWLWFADPFGIRAVLIDGSAVSQEDGLPPSPSYVPPTAETPDKNPLLTPDQEAMAESLGIDPAKLPTSITPEMEACLKTAVGEQRAAEIIGGASPTPFEILKAQRCL